MRLKIILPLALILAVVTLPWWVPHHEPILTPANVNACIKADDDQFGGPTQTVTDCALSLARQHNEMTWVFGLQ